MKKVESESRVRKHSTKKQRKNRVRGENKLERESGLRMWRHKLEEMVE